MFRELAIRGDAGALVSGYQTAVAIRAWRIQRHTDPKLGPWRLYASYSTVNPIAAGRKGLLFTAPRLGGGRWCFPVLEFSHSSGGLDARMAPEEDPDLPG